MLGEPRAIVASEFLILAIGGVAILARILVLVALSDPGTASSFDDALVVRDVAEGGHRFPNRPSAVVTNGAYTRPPLFHWLCSFLPRGLLPSVLPWSAVAADVLSIALVTGGAVALSLPASSIAVAAGFLVVSPLVAYRLDETFSAGGANPLGATLLATSLFLLEGGLARGAIALFVGATISASLVVLTDRASLLTGILVALLGTVAVSPVVGAVWLTAIAFSLVLSGLGAFRLVIGYAKASIDVVLHRDRSGASERFGSVSWTVADLPALVAAGGAYLVAVWTGRDVPVPLLFELWLLAGTVLTVAAALVAVRPRDAVRFHGWPVIVPAAVVSGVAWSSFGWEYRLLVVLAIAVGVGRLVRMSLVDRPSAATGWEPIRKHLANESPGVVVVQPTSLAGELAWKTDHRVVACLGNEIGSSAEKSSMFPGKPGDVTADVHRLRYYYDPDWAVFDLAASTSGLEPPESEPVVETSRFELHPFDTYFE